MKEPADALPLLEHAAAQKPAEFRPRFYLAEAQFQTGAFDKAEESYQRSIELDPKSRRRAARNRTHARPPEQTRRRRAALTAAPSNSNRSITRRCSNSRGLYQQNHQTAEAVALYREFPQNPAAQEQLGRLLLEGREYAGAIPKLEAAFAANANQGESHGARRCVRLRGPVGKSPAAARSVGRGRAFELRLAIDVRAGIARSQAVRTGIGAVPGSGETQAVRGQDVE